MRNGNGYEHDVMILLFFVFLIIVAAMVLGVALYLRYKRRELQHRERMAAIEKGAHLTGFEDARVQGLPWSPSTFLLRGMIWLFSGMGIFIFLLALSASAQREEPAWVRVEEANRAKSSGGTDDQVRQIMNDTQRRGMPPGAALIGLIPMGVGLAYLITYRKERQGLQATP